MASQYAINVRAWWGGRRRFGEITFKPGFSATSRRWRWLYALDYGTRTVTGGSCVTWSRWFYDNRDKLGSAAFVTRLLNHFEMDHGAKSGPVLWGTRDTAGAIAGAVIFWLVVIVLLVSLARLIWRLAT